ncbi:oxidoreductase-like domain-containing protein [Paraburkholderia denitrificans]|uniref:Oxidoreductase-like domain-containing protein n=1 Tax=Paraburkholderia denitrificans TaxID=694025 RepID=A0ABW0JES4_9BURK
MSLPPRPEDDPRPEPPMRPDDDACCGSGCDPCVFDFYAEALNAWRAELAAWEVREAARREAAAREAEGATAGDTTPKVLTRCEPSAKRAPKQAAKEAAKEAPKQAAKQTPKQAATQTSKRAPRQPRKPAS